MALAVPSNGGFISIDTSSSKTFQLPLSTDLIGRVITFKDSFGNASNQPILIQTQGGDTFQNGTTTYYISEAFGSATFVSRSGQWTLQQGNTQIIASSVSANYFIGDGSLLRNLNAISSLQLTSTVQGLGTYGYVSTLTLFSTTAGLEKYISSFIDPTELASTVVGMGTIGFISSIGLDAKLTSTVQGLGTTGYISSLSLYSSITGSLSTFSTAIGPFLLPSNLTSTVEGLGTSRYVSTASLVSTTAFLQGEIQYGLSTLSTAIQTAGAYTAQTLYLNESIDVPPYKQLGPNEIVGNALFSTITSVPGNSDSNLLCAFQTDFSLPTFIPNGIWDLNLFLDAGTIGSIRFYYTLYFRASSGVESPLFQSKPVPVGNTGIQQYTNALAVDYTEIPNGSTIVLKVFASNVNSPTRTVTCYFQNGYYSHVHTTFNGVSYSGGSGISSLSTTVSENYNYFTNQFLSTNNNLFSTVAGLGTAGYASTLTVNSSITGYLSSFSTAIGPGGTNMLTITSTIAGLGTAGYISTSQLVSTTAALIDIPELVSTVEGLGAAGYVSTASLYSSITGSLSSFSTAIGPGGTNMLTIISTVQGLGTAGYVSTLTLNAAISSFSTALGAVGGGTDMLTITSTVEGLGTAGYVSTSQLTSTVYSIYTGVFSNLTTLSLSTGSASLSTLTFIDINNQNRNILLVSSGTLTLNGSNIGGGGGAAAGLTVSDYVVAGRLNADQPLVADSDNDIRFIDDFDPQNWYNASTYFFTPTIAGYYLVSYQVWFNAGAVSDNQYNIQIQKNSSDSYTITQLVQNTTTGTSLNATKIIYMNGSTDNLRFRAYVGNTSNTGALALYGTPQGSGTFFTAALLTNGSDGGNLISTVKGLGTAGYVSTLTLNAALSSFSTALGAVGGGGTGDVTKTNLTSTVQGLGTAGYISTQQFASFSFFTVQSGSSYTAEPYGQELMKLSNISYQFSPVVLSNDAITLNVSTNSVQTYRISYMTGVNQNTFTVPRPTITMAVSTPSNIVYYPAVESIDAGGGSVTFLERLDSNSQILFYMNGLSNYTFTEDDSSLYRMSFEQVQGSVGQVFSTTFVATSFNEFTSSCTFYENITVKKSTITSNAYVSLNATINNLNVFGTTSLANLTVLSTATIGESTITNTLYTNYLRVMCNAIIGASSIVLEANTIATSNLQTSTISLLDQSTMTYKPFFISSGSIYYGSNVASAGGGGSNIVATGGSTLSSIFVGSSSNQNFIKFWGTIGEYNNTVISQQSTGGGSDELLFFQGSSINDQFRFQTTGSVRFETGVSQPRNFCNANQIATPTVLINSSSNVGIMTNNPTFTLDVTGSGRFTTLLSTTNIYAGAFYMGLFFA
jgi:hypothetical protein